MAVLLRLDGSCTRHTPIRQVVDEADGPCNRVHGVAQGRRLEALAVAGREDEADEIARLTRQTSFWTADAPRSG